MTPSANVHTSIDDLPLDVLEYIYSFLPLETLPSVASASKRLRMGATAKVRADLLMRDCISDHFCADHVLRLPQMYCLLALRIVGGGILVDLAGHPGELPEEMLGYTQPPFEVVTSALHQVVTYVDLTDVPSRAQVCDCLTQCFVRACEQGDLDIVKFIVEELKYDPSTYRSTGLITAARHNRVKVYKYLHAGGRSDPSLQTNMAIGDACSLGYLEMARLLLLDDRVDPGFMRNYPLWRASKNGHTDVVRLLLGSDKVNPGDDKSVALRVACEEGHIEIVRMMLALPHTQFVDPGIENGFCLRKAIDNRHSEVVRMLLQDMRCALYVHDCVNIGYDFP